MRREIFNVSLPRELTCYCIVGNFCGKKKLACISGKKENCGENFRGLLAGAAKRCHMPKFRRENYHKTSKSPKVFSLKSSPLYSTSAMHVCMFKLCKPRSDRAIQSGQRHYRAGGVHENKMNHFGTGIFGF